MTTPEPPSFLTVNLTATPKFEPIKIDTSFFDALAKTLARLQASWAKIAVPLSAALRDASKANAAMKAGWVPFAGMPVDEFGEDTPVEQVHRLFVSFTEENWPVIKAQFAESVRSAGVDDEALATFDEALKAHEAKLYRSVVRVLFPEIERVARETVYGGDRREEPKPKQTKGTLNTGLKDFREAIMSKLPVGVVTNTTFGLSLVEKMYEHLYKWVGESEESLGEFRRDPVPNRHASQHGYVIYSSPQNSFNMLAMAVFMFQLIMRVDAYIEKASPQEAQSQTKQNAAEGA